MKHFKWVSWGLALVGVAIILGEIARNWLFGHRIEAWVVAIGCGFGFFGFYGMDSKRAKDAFGFAVDNSVKVIGVVRSGRRSTDAIVPQVEVVPEKAPEVGAPHASGEG